MLAVVNIVGGFLVMIFLTFTSFITILGGGEGWGGNGGGRKGVHVLEQSLLETVVGALGPVSASLEPRYQY